MESSSVQAFRMNNGRGNMKRFWISVRTVLTLNEVILEISLRIFLQGALAADRIGLENEAFQYISQVSVS